MNADEPKIMETQDVREINVRTFIWVDMKVVYHKGSFQIAEYERQLWGYLNYMKDKPIYRITIHDRTGEVNTTCLDMIENFAPELKVCYRNVQELPKWAQEKIAVLMLLDPEQINNEIEGVGRRISCNVYWLFKENDNGDDSRSQS